MVRIKSCVLFLFLVEVGDLLTDLFGDLSDPVAGQINNQKILEAGDEMRDLLQSGPVNLPLLNLTELDQTAWQRLEEGRGQKNTNMTFRKSHDSRYQQS